MHQLRRRQVPFDYWSFSGKLLPRLRRRHVLGGDGRVRLRCLSCQLAAGDGLGGELVPLQRGLPAGRGLLPSLSCGDLQGGGRQFVRVRRGLLAAQRLLRLRGERDDARGGLGALGRVRVPAGVRRRGLRAVSARLLQGGDERRRVPGLPRRRDDGLRALGQSGRLRGGAGLLRKCRCRLPGVRGRLLRADDRHEQLHAVPRGRDLAGRRQQRESVRLFPHRLAGLRLARDGLLLLPRRLRPQRQRLVPTVRCELLLPRRRRPARRLSARHRLPPRQRLRRRLRLQRWLRRAQRAGVHGLRGWDLRER